MSFRLKTFLGIALIVGVLLAILIVSSMNYLVRVSEDELVKRAKTTSELILNLARDAIISTDLARLKSVADQVVGSPEIIYLRISNVQRDLVEVGETSVLARPFREDIKLREVEDAVFDVSSEMQIDGVMYGRVELGLAVGRENDLILDAQRHLSGIAAIGMLLVVLFSYVLGTYLTRGINRLTDAVKSISDGVPGKSLKVTGKDELAVAGAAFNMMSKRMTESHRAMRRSNLESSSLAVELSQQQQRLSAILNTAVDGFVIVDRGGVIDEINEAGADLFGYIQEELSGTNVSRLIPASSKYDESLYPGNDQPIFTPVIDKGRETEGVRKDGSTFPIDFAVSELKVGEHRMFVGLIHNLTETKRIRHELTKSETLKLALMESNLDALVTIDVDSCITEFSSQAEEMFGYEREQVIGHSMADLLMSAEMRPKHKSGMERYLKSRVGSIVGERIEIEAMRSNGELFPIELTIQPITIDEEILFTAFIRDITQRRAFEAELVQAKQHAETASEAKSRFLATMSHEIRSPLNVVLGSMGLLLDDELDNEKRLYAKTAKTSAKTLLSLINDILDFSKIEAGQIQLENEPFKITDLVNDIADSMIIHSHQQHVQTAIAVDPRLKGELIGDSTRLRQILINLTDNALKFTKRGSVVLSITRTSDESGPVGVRFIVQDTGIGIDTKEQDRMFGEFQQVDSSDSTLYSGTGLGLSICQGLCAEMGGTITLSSEIGRGSSFEVNIPFSKNINTAEIAPAPASLGNTRILLVGLEPLVIQAMNENLDDRGPHIQMEKTIAKAIPHINAGVDAIFIDASLSEVDLAGLSARARAMGVKNIILMSSNVTTEVGAWIRDGVYDDVLIMPVVVSRLIDSLENTLRGGFSKTDSRGRLQSIADKIEHPVMPISEKEVAGVILLAEDSPANQIVAQGLLTKSGYKVDIVHNGQQAIEAFHNGNYDLILMDLRMPIMNGLEATVIIRADEKGERIPIVALTANASQDDKDRCFAAGMDDFVTKPMDKNQLFSVLSRQLEGRQLISSANAKKIDDLPVTSTLQIEEDAVLFDRAVINKLIDDTSEEIVPGMLKVFVSEIDTRARRVADNYRTLPLSSLEDEAHTLKSCAATFGAARLHVLAKDFEEACRASDRPKAEEFAVQVPDLVKETLRVYRDQFSFLD